MAKDENTSSQDRSTPRRLGSKQVAKDEKRAATIAAYRGDGLQIRWQNMQENEQPRSQHTEGKGLQNRWQKMSFSGFIFVSHVLFASLSRLVFLSTCFYVLSSFLFWFFVAHANFVQKTKNFAGGCRPQTPADLFLFKNKDMVRHTFFCTFCDIPITKLSIF